MKYINKIQIHNQDNNNLIKVNIKKPLKRIKIHNNSTKLN